MKLACGSGPTLKSPPPLAEPTELQKCVFSDSLVTVSESGRDLGNFTVTVEFARKGQQPCMLLHAQSQGAIDESPCGTTVTGEGGPEDGLISIVLSKPRDSLSPWCPLCIKAYLTTELEVLEEHHHEYVKVSCSNCSILSSFNWKCCCLPSFSPHFSVFYIKVCESFLSSRATVWTRNVTWCSTTGRWWSIKSPL